MIPGERAPRYTDAPRPARPPRPLIQRFADHCFTGWKLLDEMQDTAPPAGDARVRFRVVAEANLAFGRAVLQWLDTGQFDADLADLLGES